MTLLSSSSVTPEVKDARDLGVQNIARQTVCGDAEAHHAAGDRPRVVGS